MKISSFLITLFALLSFHLAFSQGCSDAGFCTIDSFKPNSTSQDSSKEAKNQVKVGASYGRADHGITAYAGYLEYNRVLNDKFSLDAKLTMLSQNGNGISTFGLSDVFLNLNYKLAKSLSITAGGKIPLMAADKQLNNLPLPMDYQSSLGTFDLLFGLGYEIAKIQFVAAIQQPVTQNNNAFLSEAYPIDSDLSGWQSTNKYQRMGDVLLRVSYPINIGKRLKITASILPIYHLANDRFTDIFGNEMEIKNSEGLTLNGNAYVDYMVGKNSYLQFNLGTPFIVRKSRPDGLTRSMIMSLEYRIRF